MPERKTPQVRFKGFTDTWEQRKLAELATFTKGVGYSKSDLKETGTPVVLYGRLYTKYETVIHDVDTFVDAKDGSIYSRGGEVVVPASGETAEDIAIASVLEKSGILIGGDLNIIHPCNRLEPVFLAISISNGEPHVDMVRRAQGKSVVHLHNEDLSRIELQYPEIEEQQKIGQCFLSLDHLITLHQRECERLQMVKKSMLENCFPKNGEKVPRFRFAGFTGDWEQRKVGELLIERNEQAPMNEEYPLMAFIANEGVAPKGERYDRSSLVTDTENKLYKRTEFGDFIYSSNNLETGSIGLNKYGKACISPVYSVFHPTGIADSNFLGRRLVRKDFINSMVKWRQGVIYGQWRIHESDFLKIDIPVPSVEEQRQIGTFLDYLDHLITLHQSKLEMLKKIKESMLGKMLV